jgi:DNA primase
MPLIKEHIIDQIISGAEIVPVAQQLGLDLKKSGSNWKCCSPWNDEKTPSCMFSETKNIFKDFSSGRGGSPIELIRQVKGVEWLDAIHFLADMYHVELEFEDENAEQQERRTSKEELLKVMEAASLRYAKRLRELSDDHPAKQYVRSRFTDDEILEWGIGYAPDEWGFIRDVAKEKGIVRKVVEAGLVKEGEKNAYDFFRDRIMFPICDVRGRAVSFGGRDYPGSQSDQEGKKAPKYLNGPDTPIYDKSKTLYGLDRALNHIHKNGFVFLLEGYTDVIALHSHSLMHAVASCGTSLNELHARLINRYTDSITVVMDGDEAGQKAAERNINLLLSEGFKIEVIELPEGEDPASFLSNQKSKYT